MTEDKLDHDERLRLEALAQAVATHAMRPGSPPSAESIIEKARAFEAFVRGDQSP